MRFTIVHCLSSRCPYCDKCPIRTHPPDASSATNILSYITISKKPCANILFLLFYFKCSPLRLLLYFEDCHWAAILVIFQLYQPWSTIFLATVQRQGALTSRYSLYSTLTSKKFIFSSRQAVETLLSFLNKLNKPIYTSTSWDMSNIGLR